ncbi:hypothetical protein E2P71_05585 [Candidatus Bathyarchaeota archaeon]|nr:hypothetical protein E2P71_05585 [Candidatus Bathyarchaeota archaeon]
MHVDGAVHILHRGNGSQVEALPHPHLGRTPPQLRVHEPHRRRHTQHDRRHNNRGGLPHIVGSGVATTLAICLHEIPQEIGDFGVLMYAGMKPRRALSLNLLSALTAILGVILSLTLSGYVENLVSFLLPFAAGNFIYIAGSDLVPELQDEKALFNSVVRLALMISGVILLYILA